MTRSAVLILGLAVFVLSPAEAIAQSSTDALMNTPNVQFGIFSLRADGSADGYAGPSIGPDDSIEHSTLFVTRCGLGGTNKEAPTLASDVWKVSGRVLSRASDRAVVQIDWQRSRANGRAVTEAPNSRVVSVGLADRIELDAATVDQAGDCPGRQVALEVRFTPMMGALGPPGSGTARAGGGRVVKGSGPSGVTALAFRGSGTGGAGTGPTASLDVFVAELWLVHSAPNRPDDVMHTTTTASEAGGDFAFAPVQISTPTGSVSVRIAGTTEAGRDASGQRRFVFSATRKVTFTPTNRPPRDTNAPIDSGGIAKTIGPVPGPEEVLSYEMPPLSVPGGPSVPDHFSIRVRLAPMIFGN